VHVRAGSIVPFGPELAYTSEKPADPVVLYVYGALKYSWGFDEMGALFLLMGVAVGLLGGLGVTGTSQAFVEGFRSMAFAAVLIGVARAIFVVLDPLEGGEGNWLSAGRILFMVLVVAFLPVDSTHGTAATPPMRRWSTAAARYRTMAMRSSAR